MGAIKGQLYRRKGKPLSTRSPPSPRLRSRHPALYSATRISRSSSSPTKSRAISKLKSHGDISTDTVAPHSSPEPSSDAFTSAPGRSGSFLNCASSEIAGDTRKGFRCSGAITTFHRIQRASPDDAVTAIVTQQQTQGMHAGMTRFHRTEHWLLFSEGTTRFHLARISGPPYAAVPVYRQQRRQAWSISP